MYKLLFILIALAAVFCGLLLGTLNADAVQLDLLWVQLNWPLGLVTVLALALGVVLGSAATWALQVLPLRMQLRKVNKAAGRDEQLPPGGPDG